MPERDWREIMFSCERWLGQRAPQTAAAILRDAADALAADARPDRYGDGGVVEEFEGWMTSMLGTEAAASLPEWDELGAQVRWARDRGAAVHLDGARIWESAPYYDRSHAEIAGLFDTVYVSLYKGLGGFAGSVLAGPADVISQARVWRHRHGGTLSNLFPFAAAALRGLDQLVGQMPSFLAHARALAGELSTVPPVAIVPDRPQTPLFHVHLTGERDRLWDRALDLAQARGVWLFNTLEPSVVPGISRAELNIGVPALAVSPAEAAELFTALTAGS